jgi:hypothetical protein
MSALLPGQFLVTFEPEGVSPGGTGHYRADHCMRGIMRVIPATDRM